MSLYGLRVDYGASVTQHHLQGDRNGSEEEGTGEEVREEVREEVQREVGQADRPHGSVERQVRFVR